MINKRLLLFFLFILTASEIIYGAPMIEESQIPMPKVIYELPEALIGEFVMLAPGPNISITIYPNNKFILLRSSPGHTTGQSYGHVVKRNNTWYFSLDPKSRQNYFSIGLTEIHLTASGFSYDTESLGLLHSMRKEDIPIPEQLAQNISVSSRMAKLQYFNFNNSETEKVILNETEPFPYGYWLHDLFIDNGILKITRILSLGEALLVFEGFIEIIEECADTKKGIIRFTNGPSYYFIKSGTAEIEIKSDGSIIITMLYTPDPRPRQIVEQQLLSKYQVPAKLVLEF
jgi:hypothetical protein